ncbi:MAG: DnaD domain protein [Carnobacterium sp.]|uniref:DnaD domain protein n=1 Tax=Carnobacterium sp. TaxID=48221 RepID=UPI003C70F45A
MKDQLEVEGILSKGYGVIPKLVMKDKDLTIEAKAIYAYISSYAGNGTEAFPSIELICSDLDIGENRFHKHKKSLISKGYIEVRRERDGKGVWGKNVYTIKSMIIKNPTRQNEVMDDTPTRHYPCMDEPSMDGPTLDNDGTNNNSLTNNSLNSNNLNKEIQQPASEKANFITAWEQNGFGPISPINIEKLDYWVKDFDGKEEIIVKAIEVAEGYGKRFYNYVETILKSWENKGVKSLDDIAALEKQRDTELEAKKSTPKKNFNKQTIRKESLPDWVGKPEVEETELSDAEKEAFQERLNKLRA